MVCLSSEKGRGMDGALKTQKPAQKPCVKLPSSYMKDRVVLQLNIIKNYTSFSQQNKY